MSYNRVSTIIPSLAPHSDDLSLDRLLSPARHYDHPDDVLRDARLTVVEQRAILSSWASDACAVESMPALRLPPGTTRPVAFDTIMDALRRLDGQVGRSKVAGSGAPSTVRDQLDA